MYNTIADTFTSTGVFDEVGGYNHEMVIFCNDPSTGLKAIIGVHNTTLGPAAGGIRVWPYQSEKAALIDVLRLSRGMTLKNALAGLNLGGGKSVIIGDSRTVKTEALLRRFAKFIDNLGGKYYGAEDVGMTAADIETMSYETPFVTGKSEIMGGSGEPSTVTAYGVFIGIMASLKYKMGSESLEGKSVMVQGIGSVGAALVRRLVGAGAKVFIYDIFPEKVQELARSTGAIPVTEAEVFRTPVNIFAPCALGAILNPETIALLNCEIIAGAANNQLLDEKRDATLLQEKGILYAPDFAINSGGIINISVEFEGVPYQKEIALQKSERIYGTLTKIYKLAEEKEITTHEAALWLAQRRIDELAGNLRFR